MSPFTQKITYQAAAAFDSIAVDYDRVFTQSAIGRAQRAQVWRALARTFRRGDHVLELNCGTGEDAFFLAQRGVQVTACDVSEQMIAVAQERQLAEHSHKSIHFKQLANEELHELAVGTTFDGVFSNFSGLNCVEDLSTVASELARLLPPGAPALLCMSTRVCAWEVLWYLGHGDCKRAFRRWPGRAQAHVNGHTVSVHYPTVRKLRSLFSPWFVLRSYKGIGIVVPPSYAEQQAQKHGRLLAMMACLDRWLTGIPLVRVLGDHILVRFERTKV